MPGEKARLLVQDGNTEETDEEGGSKEVQYGLPHREAKAEHKRFILRSQIALAISAAFWVAVFGLPMYCVPLHDLLLGKNADTIVANTWAMNSTLKSHNETYEEREIAAKIKAAGYTCTASDTGRMTVVDPSTDPHLEPWKPGVAGDEDWNPNTNPTNVWCGFFPTLYLAYWPNVAQFIVFSVFLNTGTTINLAWQGFCGTLMVSINVQLLTILFPEGGLGHKCVSGKLWTVLSHYRGRGWKAKEAATEAQANHIFMDTEWAGLDGRAIFYPKGGMVPSAVWFAPGWKEQFEEHHDGLTTESCAPGSIVYDDPYYEQYGNFVCIVNYLLVVFLFLISGANRNTMVWGLSWHCFYIMGFMDPSSGNILIDQYVETYGAFWGAWFSSENFVVTVTNLIGCMFCIIATLIPGMNLCNLFHLTQDAECLTNDIDTIWSQLLGYMAGTDQSAKRFQIERQIDDLSDVVSSAQGDLNGAWWETFNIGKRGKRRQLLGLYDTALLDIRRILLAVKTGTLAEGFEDAHVRFMHSVYASAEQLRGSTTDLMWRCLDSCQDGNIQEEEADGITENVTLVKENLQDLRAAFDSAAPRVSEELSEESIFVFAMSFWARKMCDLGKQYIKPQQEAPSLFQEIKGGLLGTWDPARMFAHDHVTFAFRNFVAIAICFFIGLFGWGILLPDYNPNIPNTASVLLLFEGSHSVDLNRNLQRILGVSLGQILPVLCTWFFISLPCGSFARFAIQGIVIWGYMTFAMMIYFTSTTWGYIGCLLGGFGVYGLLQPCPTAKGEADMPYSEIIQITLAVVIQCVASAVLTKSTPQMVVTRRLKDSTEALVRAYESFFDDDLAGMQKEVRAGLASIEAAETTLAECDESRMLCQLSAEKFKLELATTAISELHQLWTNLNMILVAAMNWKVNESVLSEDGGGSEATSAGVLSILRRQFDADASVKQSLIASAVLVQEMLPDILSDEPGMSCRALRQPEEVKGAMNLGGVSLLYKKLANLDTKALMVGTPTNLAQDAFGDMGMRLMIVVRSLQHSAGHLGSIEEAIIKAAT